MIIKIMQRTSNIKQQYDIFGLYGDRFNYQGELGSLNRCQPITLFNKQTTLKGIYKWPKWVDLIPFSYIFGRTCVTRIFDVCKDEAPCATVAFFRDGPFTCFYKITMGNNDVYNCYFCFKGNFGYVSVYRGDEQVALIETLLSVTDYKYTHKLYILEEYNNLGEILAFFVLYYANYMFTKRFHMSSGTAVVSSWSVSSYNDKYTPDWREKNFPNENFFGKISLFE